MGSTVTHTRLSSQTADLPFAVVRRGIDRGAVRLVDERLADDVHHEVLRGFDVRRSVFVWPVWLTDICDSDGDNWRVVCDLTMRSVRGTKGISAKTYHVEPTKRRKVLYPVFGYGGDECDWSRHDTADHELVLT